MADTRAPHLNTRDGVLGTTSRCSADVQEALVVCDVALLNPILYDTNEASVDQECTDAARALVNRLVANADFTSNPVSVNLVSNLYFRSRLAYASPFLVPLNRSEAYTQLIHFPYKAAMCSALLDAKDVIGAVRENDSILYHIDQNFLRVHRTSILSCPMSRLCRLYVLNVTGA